MANGQSAVALVNPGMAATQTGVSSARGALRDKHIWAQSGIAPLHGMGLHGIESHGLDCADSSSVAFVLLAPPDCIAA